MSRLTRDGKAEPVSRDQILRHERGQGNIIFPVQLNTSRIGTLTRLIHTPLYMYVWSSHIAEYGSTGSRGQLNRENNIPLSPCVPENLVSRDGFSRPVPRQPAHLHPQAASGAYLRDSSRVYVMTIHTTYILETGSTADSTKKTGNSCYVLETA